MGSYIAAGTEIILLLVSGMAAGSQENRWTDEGTEQLQHCSPQYGVLHLPCSHQIAVLTIAASRSEPSFVVESLVLVRHVHGKVVA